MADESGGPSTMTVVLITMAVFALVAATTVVLTTRGTDSGSDGNDAARSSTTSSSSTTSEPDVEIDDLTGSARELAELLATGRSSTYHARYEGSSATGDGGTVVLETWADGGRFRQDTVVEVGGEAFHRANFVLADRAVACTKVGDVDWSCQEQPAGAVEDPTALTGASLDQLQRSAVGESQKEVSGEQARCFAITYDARTTELCTNTNGVPLRISTQQSLLEIELLEHEVDDGVFDPPASPTSS